jgi:hypothetical protein
MEFGEVCLVDATGVDPKIFQVIYSGLFSTELDLLVARLFLTGAIYHILIGDLLALLPCMRKYRIGWDCIVTNEALSEANFTSIVPSQKAHSFARSLSGEGRGIGFLAKLRGRSTTTRYVRLRIPHPAIEVNEYTGTSRT